MSDTVIVAKGEFTLRLDPDNRRIVQMLDNRNPAADWIRYCTFDHEEWAQRFLDHVKAWKPEQRDS